MLLPVRIGGAGCRDLYLDEAGVNIPRRRVISPMEIPASCKDTKEKNSARQ